MQGIQGIIVFSDFMRGRAYYHHDHTTRIIAILFIILTSASSPLPQNIIQ